MTQRMRDLLGGDLLEPDAQILQPGTERARGELGTQVRKTLIDRRTHWCEAQQLRESLSLRRFDEIGHADAVDSGAPRRLRIDIRRHAEIDEQRLAVIRTGGIPQ